jgi:Glycosyl transferases group 1
VRILLSFLQDFNDRPYAIPAYRFWTHYIKNGIEEAGMEWLEIPGLDWAAGLVPYEQEPALKVWKADTWEKTVDYVRENRNRFDVFLCYLYPKQIDVSAIKEIRKMGVPVVNFYCDHIREFFSPPDVLRVFDLMWVPEFEALPMYRSAKVGHIHLPMPVWVAPEYRIQAASENSSVSFIGSKDGLRATLLAGAIDGGLPLEIRGSGWGIQDSQPPGVGATGFGQKIMNQLELIRQSGFRKMIVYNLKKLERSAEPAIPPQHILDKPSVEDYIRITRESKVTLGINRVPTYKRLDRNPLVYSRLRDLEAPMLGACYLTEHTDGLAGLYAIGEEIETYRNADELIRKCRELMNSDTKRKMLRLASQKRALAEHTIPMSLTKLKLRLFGHQ